MKSVALRVAVGWLFLCVSACLSGARAFSIQVARCQASPAFTLSDVPSGTATLRIAMVDLNNPNTRWQADIPYSGDDMIACGALTSWHSQYAGSARRSPHLYRWDIQAFSETGEPLGLATAQNKSP
jgi:hypothetical protein